MSNGTVNKAFIIGNLGKDPEIRATQAGQEFASFSVATSEHWTDKNSGERREKTEWHKISVVNPNIVKVVKKYLHKGSKVCIEGKIETRSYEKNGETKYSTQVVLSGFDHNLTLLDGKDKQEATAGSYASASGGSYDNDEVPF